MKSPLNNILSLAGPHLYLQKRSKWAEIISTIHIALSIFPTVMEGEKVKKDIFVENTYFLGKQKPELCWVKINGFFCA